MSKPRRGFMLVRQKSTGKTALAMRDGGGCILVQFDDTRLLQAHGWHLYPRHHFVRRC